MEFGFLGREEHLASASRYLVYCQGSEYKCLKHTDTVSGWVAQRDGQILWRPKRYLSIKRGGGSAINMRAWVVSVWLLRRLFVVGRTTGGCVFCVFVCVSPSLSLSLSLCRKRKETQSTSIEKKGSEYDSNRPWISVPCPSVPLLCHILCTQSGIPVIFPSSVCAPVCGYPFYIHHRF